MRVITATEAKNRLGAALSFADDDSLMIEKNGKEAFMAFSASMGRHMVLASYVQGGIARTTAMNLLGLDWYGDLLQALADAGMEPPTVSSAERSTMAAHAVQVLGAA